MPLALALAFARAGSSRPARMAMIEITTRSSIKVNPERRRTFNPALLRSINADSFIKDFAVLLVTRLRKHSFSRYAFGWLSGKIIPHFFNFETKTVGSHRISWRFRPVTALYIGCNCQGIKHCSRMQVG